MMAARVVAMIMAAGLLAACDQPMNTAQKGALGGAAIGTGIGLATGGTFGGVVGGGLIGAGAGYLLGTAVDSNR
jgi:hypothetical protein